MFKTLDKVWFWSQTQRADAARRVWTTPVTASRYHSKPPLFVISSMIRYEIGLWPPTTNTIYRNVNGRTILSARARKFFTDGIRLVEPPKRPINEPVQVHIKLYPPDRRKRDIDNHLKAVLDLMKKAMVWTDDSLVDKLSVSRETVVPKGKFVIEIWPLQES